MLVTIGMNGALAAPCSHFDSSGVFGLSYLDLCEVYCTSKVSVVMDPETVISGRP